MRIMVVPGTFAMAWTMAFSEACAEEVKSLFVVLRFRVYLIKVLSDGAELFEDGGEIGLGRAFLCHYVGGASPPSDSCTILPTSFFGAMDGKWML